MWKVRGVSVSGLLVVYTLVAGCQEQDSRLCVQEDGCCMTGFVKCYRGVNGPGGVGGSGRLRIVQE